MRWITFNPLALFVQPPPENGGGGGGSGGGGAAGAGAFSRRNPPPPVNYGGVVAGPWRITNSTTAPVQGPSYVVQSDEIVEVAPDPANAATSFVGTNRDLVNQQRGIPIANNANPRIITVANLSELWFRVAANEGVYVTVRKSS